jgi:hypothetical protein
MNTHKRYSWWLVGLVVGGISILLTTGFYLQPLSGDQTRLGGYAENDFGWNQPQRVFTKPAPPLQRTYEHYSDVLVVADSFSFAGNVGQLNYPWQTFLTAKTGLSVSTIIHYLEGLETPTYDPFMLHKIINSETFQKTPPRIFIMEVIERQLGILYDLPGDCQAEPDITASLTFNPVDDLKASEWVYRDLTRPPMLEQLTYAKKYFLRYFKALWEKRSIVERLDLTTGKLFSNHQSDRLLVYEDDLKKTSWDDNKLAIIQCQLLKMQNTIQQNGKTLFVAMLVPDKLSAYSKYLRDQSLANISVIERLASNPALHLVRVDLPVKALIDEGVVDVYLPNDTHWAYRGQQAAAEAVAQYLRRFESHQSQSKL